MTTSKQMRVDIVLTSNGDEVLEQLKEQLHVTKVFRLIRKNPNAPRAPRGLSLEAKTVWAYVNNGVALHYEPQHNYIVI